MRRKLRVLFAASEAEPFIKTGGLGDVGGSLPKALKKAGCEVRVILPKFGTIAERYNSLSATTQGMYCLVDYVNFKGEGLKETERYNGQGWGLLQVLEEMRGYPTGRAATAEFSRAAGAVLTRRVQNAPAARGEQRWLPGWLNRCKTYR